MFLHDFLLKIYSKLSNENDPRLIQMTLLKAKNVLSTLTERSAS